MLARPEEDERAVDRRLVAARGPRRARTRADGCGRRCRGCAAAARRGCSRARSRGRRTRPGARCSSRSRFSAAIARAAVCRRPCGRATRATAPRGARAMRRRRAPATSSTLKSVADRSARYCRKASSSRWTAASAARSARAACVGVAAFDQLRAPSRRRSRRTRAYAAARSLRRSAPAPRGQNRRPTPRLMAKPMATSSTRTRPDAPADRLDDVEEHEEDDREAGLAGRERDRARRVRGEQDARPAARPRAPPRACRCRSRAARRRRSRPRSRRVR